MRKFYFKNIHPSFLQSYNPPDWFICECGMLVRFKKREIHWKLFHTYLDGSVVPYDIKSYRQHMKRMDDIRKREMLKNRKKR